MSSSNYNAIASLDDIEPINETTDVNVSVSIASTYEENSMMKMSENVMFGEYQADTVSNIAASMFPLINYKNAAHLDTKYLKQIGICVFKAYTDNSNSGKINY